MKNVYGSSKPLIICFLFVAALSCGGINLKEVSEFVRGAKEAPIPYFIFLALFGLLLILRFVSFWAYDETGFVTKTVTGNLLKKFKWEDVQAIFWGKGRRGFPTWAIFSVEGGTGFKIGWIYTHDYLKVLIDVVRIAKSKKIFVDPIILKMVDKYL